MPFSIKDSTAALSKRSRIEMPATPRWLGCLTVRSGLRLVDSGTVRLLDLLVIRKAEDGTVEALEIDDSDERDDIRELEASVAEILAAHTISESTGATR